MKLGDSLGRSRGRKRRRGKGAPGDSPPVEATESAESTEAFGQADPVVAQSAEPATAEQAVAEQADPPDVEPADPRDVEAGAGAESDASVTSEPPAAVRASPAPGTPDSDAEPAGADGGDGGTASRGEPEPWKPRKASETGGRRPASKLGWLNGRWLLAAAAAFAIVGWGFGYSLATSIFFPAPPPPGDLFEVPDLRGLGLASAEERLAGAGLELGQIDSLQHPEVAAALILGQSPLPGQVAQPETAVRVTLSAGPQMRSVPDVLRLDESRARIVLETSGFVVSVDTAEAEEPRGRVVDVLPPPDSVVALPAQVRLTVSTGPPVVPMPLVLGLEQAEAEQLLDSLGLVVSAVEEVFRFGRDQGIVVEQEPAADTDMQRGSSVRLKVGRRGAGLEQ